MAFVKDNRPTIQAADQDAEGYRIYGVTFLVAGTVDEGPAHALEAVDLFVPVGEIYAFANDLDIWAYRLLGPTSARMRSEKEPNRFFDVLTTFSTKPPNLKRCQDDAIQDPLQIPDRISGSFVKYQEEVRLNRFGAWICNSAWELMTGPEVEFDRNRPQIIIEQNRAQLELPLLTRMVDTVNGNILWGLPPRSIKLSDVTWEEKFYGRCEKYYTRKMTFDIRFEKFDRDIPDYGTKVLRGAWNATTGAWDVATIAGSPANPANPSHFMRAIDPAGNPTRILLNGAGMPAGASNPIGNPNSLTWPFYMSISGTHAAGDITKTDKWVMLATDPRKIPVWEYVNDPLAGLLYSKIPRGTLRSIIQAGVTAYFLVVRPQGTKDPPGAGGGTDWFNVTPTNKGFWNPASTTYAVGDFVSIGTNVPGIIHVEKYDESDFTLLDIPTDF